MFLKNHKLSSTEPTVVGEAKKECSSVPRSTDGQIGGLFPLRSPVRWWESGGAPCLCLRRVDSRLGFPGDAGRVVVVASLWNKVTGALSPPRRGPLGRSRRASGVVCS